MMYVKKEDKDLYDLSHRKVKGISNSLNHVHHDANLILKLASESPHSIDCIER